MKCQAFTTQQINKISEFVDPSSMSRTSASAPPTDVLTPEYGAQNQISNSNPHPNHYSNHNHNQLVHAPQVRVLSVDQEDMSRAGYRYREQGPFGALAREFGVETQLVQALVQRLSGMC